MQVVGGFLGLEKVMLFVAVIGAFFFGAFFL